MSDGYASESESININTTSDVMLGLVDTQITEQDGPIIEDTFVGGQPVWLHPQSPPPTTLLRCKNCESELALFVQAYAPLPNELYDRVVYVFGCPKNGCQKKQGSFRAIRGVCKDPSKIKRLEDGEKESLQHALDEKLKLEGSRNMLFGGESEESNPFGSSNSNPFESNPFSGASNHLESSNTKETFASVAIKAAPESKKTESCCDTISSRPELPGHFLYTEEERFKKIDKSKLPEGVHIDENALDLESEVLSSSNHQINADYARIANSLTDDDFQKFSDVISHNPQQVIRYELGGTPLLYSRNDDIGVKLVKGLVPKPGFNPSSERQFELQVMPKLIIDFEKDLKDKTQGMEWVTIVIYSDKEDYTPQLDANYVGYVEEWCGVQWEETAK